ncbi:cytochrome C [Geomobilimonas luticola]|uniref:Cytochrome C n=1 Tax=Geomobilimonas luticola TaxID=1114878 RepID=A0ABS5SCS9_9BACT|nr:cytochrome C [Geomobilimonas luticola]MBT0653178.1 cytochrome C [Geomobilimonas luticola]
MKKRFWLAVFLMSVAVASQAADGPTQERGRELFESTKLGTNGKSCASCHPGGRKLEWAATFDDGKLAGITNKCIDKALKGKPLDPAGTDMQSLIMYMKTFAGPGK